MSHAEYKAILGGPSVRGCTLYVTQYPCNMCAKVIVQAGITKVVYGHKPKRNTYKYSEKILNKCLGETNIKSVALNKSEVQSIIYTNRKFEDDQKYDQAILDEELIIAVVSIVMIIYFLTLFTKFPTRQHIRWYIMDM